MEKAAYEEMRALEDHHWWFRGRRTVLTPLLKTALGGALGRSTSGMLLDLGCGTGGNLVHLQGLFPVWKLVGLDRDETALKHTASRALSAQLVCATGMRLPVQDATLQCVTAFDVIEHFSDDRGLLREIHRVLCRGGQLIATVPAYPAMYSTHDDVLHHHRRYRTGELETLMRETGFEIVRRHGFNFVLLPMVAAVRFGKSALARLDGRRARTGKTPERSTDFFELPGPLNAMMGWIFVFERWLVRRIPLLFGASFVIHARKP